MPTALCPNDHVTPSSGQLKGRKKGPLDTSTPINGLRTLQNRAQLPSTAKDSVNLSMESSHGEHTLDYDGEKSVCDSSDVFSAQEGRYNLRQRSKNELMQQVESAWMDGGSVVQNKNNVRGYKQAAKSNREQTLRKTSTTSANGKKRFSYELSPSLSEISPVATPEQRVSSLLHGQRNIAKYESLGTTDFYPEQKKLDVSMLGRKFFVERPAVMYCLHCFICVTYAFILFKIATYFGIDNYLFKFFR